MSAPSTPRKGKRHTYQHLIKQQPVDVQPLLDFELPPCIRGLNSDLDQEFDRIRDHARSITSNRETTSTSKANCHKFVEEMHDVSIRQGQALKRASSMTAEMLSDRSQRSERRKTQKLLRDASDMNLRIRCHLTGRKKQISSTMFAKTHTGTLYESFIDELLLSRAVEYPAGSSVNEQDYRQIHSVDLKRGGSDQTKFRNLLIATYSDRSRTDPMGNQEVWCPVLGDFIDGDMATAAHIVPVSFRPYRLAGLLGMETDSDSIWDLIFSEQNGLILHASIEKALDDGSVVIVPTKEDQTRTEYEFVVLLQSKLTQSIAGHTLTDEKTGESRKTYFKDVHRKKLVWYSEHRPSTTHLYIRYLCTRLIRRRLEAESWEQDLEQLPKARAWADMRPLREGMLRKLAAEIGDFVEPKDNRDDTTSRSSSGASSVTAELQMAKTFAPADDNEQMETDASTELADAVVQHHTNEIS